MPLGDPAVRRVLSDAGRTVGRALADLANNLNPELVVVGGSLGPSISLIDGIRASIDRYAQPDTAAVLRVVAGELGERAEVVGAVALAIARVVGHGVGRQTQSRSSSQVGLSAEPQRATRAWSTRSAETTATLDPRSEAALASATIVSSPLPAGVHGASHVRRGPP